LSRPKGTPFSGGRVLPSAPNRKSCHKEDKTGYGALAFPMMYQEQGQFSACLSKIIELMLQL
jgi:hypothetical protein